ncbi:helix-turn-helix domain-containing protein [Serratia marcescens]|uniref:helix-turn-helix domain-containing protein n=1 Tax=Serratia TaxID=613 RepID=UPI000C13E9B9|nr:helix-turn-helix domain-containing protein [Serratia marcescens]MDX6807933.1 helix-turn-helix domain-containing protein [Serratia marcescens]PHY87895.1 helix-turn-helix domain-containing protein [Serratia marcescens]HBC7448626.1 helix-turn-helix domain-containing protein [Serratia marcescens]
MSMNLMAQAMSIKVGNPLRKLVLIKMADNANDEGECWPSYQHIADHCECSKSAVKAHITALIKMGLLSKENRLGVNNGKGNTSNIYQLTLGNPMSSENTAPVSPKNTGGSGKSTGEASENTAPVSSGGTPCVSTWHQNQSLEPKDQNPSCQVAPQPDESGDEKFLSRHPEAVVFSAKKKIWGSAEDLKCAEWIRSRIVKLYEQAAESDGEVARPKEPNWADWANEIRLMCSQDGRTHKQICELFAKANRDPFWCKNILSPSKLREKWDDLTLKLSVNPASPAGGHWNTAEAWENTL